MDKYVPTDKPGLIRDTQTQAVISSDRQGLLEYRRRAKALKENQDKIESINTVKDDVNNLKNEMGEIKELLLKLISTKDND